jgi:alkanesulfonate monooxygenase SsuD/methylene tetrahydromethanopterin reductase-like flavin-dependent oxidoreductase (luciferase family)
LEQGRFDGIFIADVLGTYDVYGGNDIAALRQGAQIPVADPLLLVSAMAAVTEHLGFGITTGTGFEHPYPFARRLSTLDHLTKGRIGWNVVTGYLPSAARNFGADDQLDHDERYNQADEYLEVLYKLCSPRSIAVRATAWAAPNSTALPDSVSRLGASVATPVL